MRERSRAAAAATVALIGIFGAINAWRAATQSFTIDEAYAYREYTTGSTDFILGTFHSSHHLLFTILSKLSWKAFGVSEFTLRLPTVLAGWVFLVVLAVIARRLCGEWGGFVAFLAIASNPLLLDHMSCARGYGLGLAFLSGGLLLLAEASPLRLATTGLCLGLAVASNLTYMFPSAALIVAVAIVHRRVWPVAIPFAAVSAVFLARPIIRTGSMDLFFGNESLRGTIDSIVNLSVPSSGLLRDAGIQLAEVLPWIGFAGGGAMFFLWLWRKEPWMALLCGTAPLTLLFVTAAHRLFATPYPYSRTGLYFIPLVLLAGAAIARVPWGKWVVYGGSLCIIAVQLAAFRANYYGDWIQDADNKEIASQLKKEMKAGVREKLCSSWLLESSLNFYRDRLPLDLPPIVRNDLGPDCTTFVLLPEDQEIVARENMRTVTRGPISGTLLAVQRDSIIGK